MTGYQRRTLLLPGGGVATAGEVAHSGTTTLTSSDLGRMHACTVSSAYTITLPTPVGVAGLQIGLRVVPSSTNLLTVATAAGNIDGVSTRIMWAGESAFLESDGTNWVKIGGRTLPMMATVAGNAATTVATAATTAITLDTSKRDNTGLMVNTGGSQLVIKRPGVYTVRGRIGMLNAPANAPRVLIQVYKSATPVVQSEISALSGAFTTFPTSDDITLAAGDTLNLYLFQNSGSNWGTTSGAGQNSPALVACELVTW